MYPTRELDTLAERKRQLRNRIAVERADLTDELRNATRPVAWASELQARWQNLSPVVRLAAPVVLMAIQRKVLKRIPVGGAAIWWVPLVLRALRAGLPLLTRATQPATSLPDRPSPGAPPAAGSVRERLLRGVARVLG